MANSCSHLSSCDRRLKAHMTDLLYSHNNFDRIETIEAEVLRKCGGSGELIGHVRVCTTNAWPARRLQLLAFEPLTFSKDFSTSRTRVVISSFDNPAAAEYAARGTHCVRAASARRGVTTERAATPRLREAKLRAAMRNMSVVLGRRSRNAVTRAQKPTHVDASAGIRRLALTRDHVHDRFSASQRAASHWLDACGRPAVTK